MQPDIIVLSPKDLVGISMHMSHHSLLTRVLWQNFMPRRGSIENTVSTELISMSIYPANFFSNYNPSTRFEKWAAVEVSAAMHLPEGLEGYYLEGGMYAVFHYKGLSSDPSIFSYIFNNWLPDSKYLLDDRPHFEVLGSKYKNDDPNSEEMIYIPIKVKS